MLRQLALATFAAATLLAVQSPANSGPGPVIVTGGWGCRDCGFSNGTQHSGLTVQGVTTQISGVILPSGEIVALP